MWAIPAGCIAYGTALQNSDESAHCATMSADASERELPRPNGMTQKVQRWSQPFWTWTKPRVWPTARPARAGRSVVCAMMSEASIFSAAERAQSAPRLLEPASATQRSAQQIVTQALDAFLAATGGPALDQRVGGAMRTGGI